MMSGSNNGGVSLAWLRDLIPLIMLVISGLVWGMKLEADRARDEQINQEQTRQLAELHAAIDRGILPVTSERLAAATVQIQQLQIELDRLKADCVRHMKENAQ